MADVYAKDHLPGLPPVDTWPEYDKKVPTRMHRMDGPFSVMTSGGLVICQDGFIAIDADNHPYPVTATDHDKLYEERNKEQEFKAKSKSTKDDSS